MSFPFEELARELAAACAVAGPPSLPAEAPPGAPAGSPAAAPSREGVRLVEHRARGFHLDAAVPASRVVAAAELLDRKGFALDAVSGMDWMAQEEMEVVYDYFHPACLARVVVRARVPRAQPELPTISGVFPGANWHERETHEFFGIRFEGHPNLTPLLLPEDATYHPLRKDFSA